MTAQDARPDLLPPGVAAPIKSHPLPVTGGGCFFDGAKRAAQNGPFAMLCALHNMHSCVAASTLIKSVRMTILGSQQQKQKHERPQAHEVDMKMNLVRSFNEWRRYRETSLELKRLSGRELEDIGFARGDIASVARRAARA